ncbi:hypothetical protein SADUNF_Sadunf03G0122400 [Salix dunnii]|uniref:C2 domain-containing protein n=1 Tax=Salix dunnii TaxID=1413687 RepID=A0A835N4G7_9ROSI|nr:hypothetical protein SADUNF_Sadunf03G0122400 [Salix dunnii]
MEGISLELKVISCRDLKTFNFFQKLSVFVDVSIFIDEPKKNEQQRRKTALDFLYGVLKKNEKQRQRLQRQKTPPNTFIDEAKKNEQQQLLQRQKTPVDREGGSNPEWNHMMLFDLNTTSLPDYGDHLFIKFELRCQVSIFGSRTIGEVCVPFKDLNEEFNGSVRLLSYQVRNSDGRPNGVLNFSYEVNGKVEKNEIDSPRVDLPPGIRFSSPKKFHYPSSEVDVKSSKPRLYPSLNDISFSSPPPGTGFPSTESCYPVKPCYAMPPPAFPLQLPTYVAVGHRLYQHQYLSPLTESPGSYRYTTKTAGHGCGLRGNPGGGAIRDVNSTEMCFHVTDNDLGLPLACRLSIMA